ncbi:hypothetical protein RRG08_066037 [Elysia crispata]|uniref:Uncharacterized protein n=1 Tax=Elysia crispata TaxID=231223 RepID=A0AAE0Y2N9_9GAST|nr:hypothetical protein RRG08_066037 [Elysia crispata]
MSYLEMTRPAATTVPVLHRIRKSSVGAFFKRGYLALSPALVFVGCLLAHLAPSRGIKVQTPCSGAMAADPTGGVDLLIWNLVPKLLCRYLAGGGDLGLVLYNIHEF